MKRSIACSRGLAVAFLTASVIAHGAAIHKCAQGSGVTYQAAPCAADQRELAVRAPLSTGGPADTSTAAVAADAPLADFAESTLTAPTADVRWLPFRPRMIATGMTDDEVLNAPNGGVPTRIDRTRDGRSWRELWVYQTRDGVARALEFRNGRLTGIVDDGPAGSLRLALLGR